MTRATAATPSRRRDALALLLARLLPARLPLAILPLAILALAILALAILAVGASPASAARPHKQAFKAGLAAQAGGDWDWAVVHYQRAVDLAPHDPEYRTHLRNAQSQASYLHFELAKKHLVAGNLQEAILELQQTVALNPAHQYAYVELEKAMNEWRLLQAERDQDAQAIARLKTQADKKVGAVPKLDPRSNIPIQFALEDKTLEEVFQVIQDVSNINVIFDESVRRDDKISFTTDNVTLEEALDLLMLQQSQAYKVYNDHTIIVYPDNQTKQREYEDQVIRTFYLSNADVKEVNALLRGVVEVRKTAVNEGLNAITIRDSQDSIAIAGRIIESNDKAKAELVIDLEILEVNRTKMKTYGIDIRTGTNQGINTTFAFDDDQVRLNNLRRLGQLGSWIMSPIPSAVLTLVRNDADTRVLSRPQVRVTDGERVTVHLGDQVPIPNTTFNTSQTVGGNIVPITSFTYQNVGIQIQLEPRVHHNREITLKLQAEISAVTSVNVAGQPTIGSREVETVIRLRDGESNLLAGLFQQNSDQSLSGVPGLMSVPGLRHVFGQTSSNSREGEIVITVTPHIIRVPDIGSEDLAPLHVGTQRKTKLRGFSQYGVGGSPFGQESGAPPEDLFTDLRPGGEARDLSIVNPDLALATGTVTPAAGGPGRLGAAPSAPSAEPPPEGAREAPGPTGGAPPAGGPGPGPPAGGTVSLQLVPSLSSVAVGETFAVAVQVDTAGQQLAHAPYHVLFDPALAEVIAVDEGDFFRSVGVSTFWLPNVQPGRVMVGHSQQGRGEGASGRGTLALLRLRATRPGTLQLSFDAARPADAINDPLPFQTAGAAVAIRP